MTKTARRKNSKAHTELINLALDNAENKTGHLDYNKYGEKDNIGFSQCGEKFVDNFILMCFIPDYHVVNGQFVDVGATNASIRASLKVAGLFDCHVKAVGNLRKASKLPDLNKVIRRCIEKETCNTKYYTQDFKVSCSEYPYDVVLSYLRSGSYRAFSLYLNDVDVTRDFIGSFDRQDLIDHLLTNEEERFCLDGSEDIAECRILMNAHKVGYNCLTWIETVSGIQLRYKIYNKFVQMLESESVRKNIGNHWESWVGQWGTRLADARDIAIDRGLTRTEVTFYCSENIPSDQFMADKLQSVVASVPRELVFSTPIHLAWKAYCESFSHSLVVIDKVSPNQRGLVVYSVNEVTKKVSGKQIEEWENKEKYCLANLTLSERLPLDIITIDQPDKETDQKLKYKANGTRYIKENINGKPFKTRLIYQSVYEKCRNNVKVQYVADNLVEAAGLLPNCKCSLSLPTKKVKKATNVPLMLHQVEEFRVRGVPTKKRRNTKKQQQSSAQLSPPTTKCAADRSKVFEEASLQVVVKQKYRTDIMDLLNLYSQKKHTKLSDMTVGIYNVIALKAIQRKYDDKFIMILEIDGKRCLCYSNFDIEEHIHRLLPRAKRLSLQRNNVLYDDNNYVGTLTIMGSKRNARKELIPDCHFSFSKAMQELIGIQETDSMRTSTVAAPIGTMEEIVIPIIPELQLKKYNSFPDLSDFPVGSYHTVRAKGIIHFNRAKRLVVQLDDGKIYRGGENLLQYEKNLKNGTRFYIHKYMKSRTQRGVKFAVCQIVEDIAEISERNVESSPTVTTWKRKVDQNDSDDMSAERKKTKYQ